MVKLAVPFLLLALLLSGCKSTVLESLTVSPYVTFTFAVKQKAHVKATVENMYNTIVATPVDTELPAGNHSITFKINNITGGVYYFIMEAKGIDSSYYEKTTRDFNLVL